MTYEIVNGLAIGYCLLLVFVVRQANKEFKKKC